MAGIGAHDPRTQAHVSLTYKTAQNQLTATRQHDMSEIYSTRRMAGGELLAKTAERTYRETSKIGSDPPPSDKPHFSRQATELEQSVHPPFLTRDGRWDQNGVPHLLTNTQSQAVTTIGKFDSTAGTQAPKAISAVHSYADISPVLTTEYVADSAPSEVSWQPTINQRGTAGVYERSGPADPTNVEAIADSLRASAQTGSFDGKQIGDPVARKTAVDAFWHSTSQAVHLRCRDVARAGPESRISTRATAGTPNCRLVGGKWRNLPRPVEGEQLYTDFYGRCDKEHANYYGRTYHYLPQ